MWSLDLDRHVSSFLDQSVLLAQWDDALLSSASSLQSMQSEVKELQQVQLRLNKSVDVVQAQQKELNAQLDQLEQAMDTFRPTQSTAAELYGKGGEELRRDETYRLAEEVDEHLTEVQKTLEDTIEQLNMQGGRGGGEGRGSGRGGAGSMWAQLTDILNVHQQSLQWLEREAEVIEQQLHRAGSDVGAVKTSIPPRQARLTYSNGDARR